MFKQFLALAPILMSIAVSCTALFFTSCGSPETPTDEVVDTTAQTKQATLKVALYQYVPNLEPFQTELEKLWYAEYPDVQLEFVKWDCYEDEYDPTIDVFVFDGIFLSNYVQNGYLTGYSAGELGVNRSDFLPFAWEAVQDSIAGELLYYGFPQIGCTNMIFHRNTDTELKNASTLSEIYTVIGDAPNDEVPLPAGEGLLIDLSGGTTCACLYVDAAMDYDQPYTWYPELPAYDELEIQVVANLRTLLYMGGADQATYDDMDPWDSYIRGQWFDEGSGRGFCGFTENMHRMKGSIDDVGFKIMPYSDTEGINLFYTDIVGVNSTVTVETATYCYFLASMMCSEEYITNVFSSFEGSSTPQYLMPVRYAAFDNLGQTWPQYLAMRDVVVNADGRPFRLGPYSKDWLAANKDSIQAIITTEADKIRAE